MKLKFHKPNDRTVITETPVVFRTKIFTFAIVKDIDPIFHALYNELTQKIHDCQANDREWVVNEFIDVDIGEYNINLLSTFNDTLNFYFE